MFDRSAYNAVIKHARDIRTYETILDLLTWDQETMMPKAANDHRTEQMTLLAGMIHERKCAPSYYDRLERLLPHVKSNTDEAIVVQRLHKQIARAKKLPTAFVQTLSRATSEAFDAWQRAKHHDQWLLFEPHLERLVTLMHQKADYLGYKTHPLDALLDEHDPGTSTQEISTLFRSLQAKLRALLPEVQQSPFFNVERIDFPTTHEEQMKICKEIVSMVGFDWNRGRLDTSEHPFSTAIHPTDSRITIRRRSTDLLDQIMSALHEAGHGMYEMGFERHHFGTPLAEAASLSIHESQSRLWETAIGRSRAFATQLFSLFERLYKGRNPYPSEEALYLQLNRVECSLIRTQADEVTYPFHVILRFEIEKELLDGSLAVRDIPDRWNMGMKESLGIIPRTCVEGCLQDVHWSLGSFGYFPTYTLGSIYAICFFQAMGRSMPQVNTLIAQGAYAPLHAWLFEHVWRHGKRYISKELVTNALGRPPKEDDYIEYLRSKYVI